MSAGGAGGLPVVLAITGVYEAGYLLLAAGVATASFFLGRAALRRS